IRRASARRELGASPSCCGFRPRASQSWSCAAATTSRRSSARRSSQRLRVPRTATLAAVAGSLIAFNWLRLEEHSNLAQTALLVGAGWPATLLSGHDFLRGAALLAGLLVLLVGLRERPRGFGYAAVAGAVVVLAGVAASSSPALQRHAFVDWQSWNFSTAPAK